MNNKDRHTIVLSLGGSLIVPDSIDTVFLLRFKKIIEKFSKRRRFIIICGGGNTSRIYQHHLKKLNSGVDRKMLDILGVAITKNNALLLRGMFSARAEEKLLSNPTNKISTKKNIIIGHGWKVGYSSDKVAVIAAQTFGVKTVVNLSNIMFVYNKDPKKYQDAKPYRKMNWRELRKIVGNVWIPGAHVPFDPVAAKLAEKLHLELIVLNGRNLRNFEKYLSGEKFLGTQVM